MEPTQDPDPPAKPARPGWVWAISFAYFLGSAATLISYALIYSGAVTISETLRADLDSRSGADFVATLLILGCNLFGAIDLFLLRKGAYKLFMAALALSLVEVIYDAVVLYQATTTNYFTVLGAPGIIGLVAGTAVSVTIILYTKKLSEKGILK